MGKIQFNIIEGSSNNPIIPKEQIESFKNDYLKGVVLKELKRKYNLQNMKKLNDLIKELELPSRHFVPKRKHKGYSKKIREPKNYSYNQGTKTYYVTKKINNELKYFGGYKTEEEAKKRVQFLKKHNWLQNGEMI